MQPSRRAVQALLAAAAWLKRPQELQWLIGAGQGIIQSSSALGETARSLTSTAPLLARAAKRPGRVPSLEQLLESDDYFVRVKPQGSLPEGKDSQEQQAGASASSAQTTPSRHQQQGQQEQQLGQGHASGHKQKREQGQRQQALNDRGQAAAAGPGKHAYGRLLAREFEDEVPASGKGSSPPSQSARESQGHAGPSKLQQQHSARKASNGKSSDASSLNAPSAAQRQQQDHTTTAKALWQQTFASKHELDGHPGVVGGQSRLAALQQDSSAVGPAAVPAAQASAAAHVSGPRGASQEQRKATELGDARRDALRSGVAGRAAAAVSVGQKEPGRREGSERTPSLPQGETSGSTPPRHSSRKLKTSGGSSPWGAEGDVDSIHMDSTADAGGAPDLGQVQGWGKGGTGKQWGGRRSDAQPGAARKDDWHAAVPGRAAYDALLGTVRHARHLPDLLAALRQHLRHGSPVSPRGAAQAVATAARLLDRGMLSRASPSGPGAAPGAGTLPSTARGLSDEAAEVMSFITEHAMPVVRVGLHSLPPQDLVPLTWGVAKLRLASDSELVESLLRELLAEDAEALRCRGSSGVLMVAQALCHLQSQGSFGARPGRTSLTPPVVAAQVPSVAAAASTPSAEALQPATGPGNLPGVQGLGMGGEGLGLQDLSSSSLSDDGGQEPSAGLIWQGIEAAQGATQQQQVWDSEQAAALAQLSQQLVQQLGRTAQQLLASMRMPQVSGIASCLARLRYRDTAFYNAAAAKALQHLDSTNPFVLSLLLRALAEADAHVPALLAAAEPVLVEGVLGGHFTHKGLKDVVHPYTQASHPCPTLLPIISQAAADAAASGSMDDRSLRAIATRASSLGPLHPALATALEPVDATAVATELRG